MDYCFWIAALIAFRSSPTSLWDTVWAMDKILLLEGSYSIHWAEVEFVPNAP